MRIVFFGTPEFAIPSLQHLLSRYDVCAVVTQPDRPGGRGKKLLSPPIKLAAEKEGVPVLQPDRVKSKKFINILSELNADMYVTTAYGQILSEALLEQPRLGCINVHASLLPKYRGAAPIQWAIINGESKTGITIMYTDKGIDTGDMILKREIPIEPDDDYGTLQDKLALLGASALEHALTEIERGTAERTKQDHCEASYAPMITKEMGHVDWAAASDRIHDLIRGMTPLPGAYTSYNGEILKLCQGKAVYLDKPGAPGEIVAISDGRSGVYNNMPKGLIVKTGDGCYCVTELQAPGGKRMRVSDYLRGHALETGVSLN